MLLWWVRRHIETCHLSENDMTCRCICARGPLTEAIDCELLDVLLPMFFGHLVSILFQMINFPVVWIAFLLFN